MKKRDIKAQIMVIVLLLLSILSIVALTATLTAVRDNEEQVQNKKYQQYYSLGERTIIDMQRYLGNSDLSTMNGSVSLPSEAGSPLAGNCSQNGNQASCEFPEISSAAVGGGESSETLSVITSIVDTDYILNHTTQKDQDILLELTPSSTNITYLLWDDNTVAWGVTYDSKDSSNNYYSQKAVFGRNQSPFGLTNTNASCVSITDVSSNPTIRPQVLTKMGNPAGSFSNIIEIRTTTTGCNTALDYRIRAYKANEGEITFSLVKDGSAVPLQRVITTITTTSETEANLQTEDNPTAVLSTSYLLATTPLNLFDYVLRTEQGIVKN